MQQKRDDLKKRFNNRFLKYKSRLGYKRYLQQYIAHYEGNNKNSNTDDVAYFLEELSIDIFKNLLPNVDIIDELFFASINAIQNIESTNTINLLANNAFKYQIIFADSIIAFIVPRPYSFTILTKLQYDKLEFKELLIHTGTATRSTGGIGQLKALQKIISLAKLDKTMAESVNFIFEVRNTLSIDTVNLDTPIRIIIFYIIQINTPFLLCLTDIDKLGAYFNNLTNKVV